MVIQSFLPVLGGAQRQVDLLGPPLRRQGVELTVVTRRPPGTARRELRPGLDVRRMPGPDRGPLGSIAYTTAGALSLMRMRPDVVHAHDLLSPSTIALLSHPVVRSPVVAKVLSTGPGGDLDRLLTKPVGHGRLRAMARTFSAFVCLSDEVAEELGQHGVGADRLRRIPNGVDSDRFRPASSGEREAERKRLGLDPDGVLALYTGRFAPVKRLDLLIDAVARVPDLRLAMVGEGSEEQRLRGTIEARGLEGRIKLLPLTSDPAPLYRAADLYVCASSTEGMSNSVLEAMASGLPVVAATASGMAELVTPQTGVLVADVSDSAAFAAALAGVAGPPRPPDSAPRPGAWSAQATRSSPWRSRCETSMTRSSRVDEDLEEPPLSEVLVLCYHAVSESWDSELAVTPEQLERQVTILLERGYEPARFLDAVAAPPAPRTLAITFDDAYRSVYELARPVLQRLGATASVYAPTDWIGSERPMQWPGIDSWLGTPQEEELLPMGWGELGELCEAGWEVGSHTSSHPHLTDLDDGRLAAELEGSRLACAAGLDRPCETIAYPYGDVDDRVVAATAAAGYRAAGALPHAPHAAEALRWPRIGIYRWDGPTRFRLKVSPLVRRARGLPLRGLLDPVGRLTRTRAVR